MLVWEILILVAIALLFSLLLVGAFGWRRRENEPAWPAAFFVFLILFPTLWVAELWVRPAGPALLDVYWVPLIVVGLIVALILAALVPPRRRRHMIELVRPPEPQLPVRTAFGFFFWVLMILLIGTILAGYGSRY
jgi:hypothetical protein